MLTPRQQEALQFIAKYQDSHQGESPTLVEISAALGVSSKSNAHRVLTGLEERGAIRRIPNLWRAIEIVRRDLLRGPARESARHIPIYRSGDCKLMGFLPTEMGGNHA